MQSTVSCRVAWTGPCRPHTGSAGQTGHRAGPARAAPPAALPVLERESEEPAARPGLTSNADAGRQPAGAGGSSGVPTWHHVWRQQLQRHTRGQQHGHHHLQPTWVLQGGGGLLLLDPAVAGEGPSSWDAGAAAPGAGEASLAVQLNDPPQRQSPQLQQADGGGTGGSGRDPDQQEFFANVGDAIRTLREDYPLLFVKDLNYSIYRDDLTFRDPNIAFHGLKTYKAIFWGLRLHGRLLLHAANVRVLRIWQPEDAVIKLRWQVNATPRLSSTPGTFDGISVYRLDRRGKVYQHEVTDVQLRDPPITNPLLYGLNYILSPRPQVQQMPCPGSWITDCEEDLASDVLAAVPVALPRSRANLR